MINQANVEGQNVLAGNSVLATAADNSGSPTVTNSTTAAAADHFPLEQIIPILPQLIALLLVAIVIWIVGPRRVLKAIRSTKKITIAGLEIELADDVKAAAGTKRVTLSKKQVLRVARDLVDAAPLLSCSRILWVDDNPTNNADEMRALRRVCVGIDLAESTDAARQALKQGVYDVVISDMRRGQTDRAGEEILEDIRKAPLTPHIIFYVGDPTPVPEGAFGLTVRPDELFRLIVEAMRQRRG